MPTVTMTLEEYEALVSMLRDENRNDQFRNTEKSRSLQNQDITVKRKTSAYSRRYKAAFRKIAPKYKLKSGKWKKNGFKTAVKLAHKEARK